MCQCTVSCNIGLSKFSKPMCTNPSGRSITPHVHFHTKARFRQGNFLWNFGVADELFLRRLCCDMNYWDRPEAKVMSEMRNSETSEAAEPN